MDTLTTKIEKYQTIITDLFEFYAGQRNSLPNAKLKYEVLADIKRNHFQLTRLGWHNHKFNFLVLVHFDLNQETGKIWIQQNNTEWLVADDLIEKGIPASDIVLGFKPEYIREVSAFAVS
jgi:hypothetical protein